MSERETPMIRRYWKHVGGTLVEEFPLVRNSGDTVLNSRLTERPVPGTEERITGEFPYCGFQLFLDEPSERGVSAVPQVRRMRGKGCRGRRR